MAHSELYYLQYCKKLIEEKLKWINSQEWQQRDYRNLIKLIEENTGILLSLSTIKRIWKKDPVNLPHPSTLDAFAKFLGYHDWLHFKESNQDVNIDEPTKISKSFPIKRALILLMIASVLIVIVILFQKLMPLTTNVRDISYDPDSIAFICKYSATSGVPNTAIFNYNVNSIKADSFFIQQSWDENQRERIQKIDRNLTSIYYYPGYHKAKLIANDSIIKQTDVQIYTNNWLAMIRDGYMDQIPVYVRDNDLASGGELYVSKDHLKSNQIELNQNTLVSYYYVKDFGGLSSSDFSFKTKVKCDSIFNFTCPHITICILGVDDMNFIPLITSGCVGFINIKMGDAMKYGKNNDFSSFGVDIYQWQEIELQVKNNLARIFLNGRQILELPFNKDIGDIVGFNFNFSGTGAIDYVKLSDQEDELVYFSEF